MRIPSPNSGQIKLGRILINRLGNAENSGVTTKELSELIQQNGLNYTPKNVTHCLSTFFVGIVNYAEDEKKWMLDKGLTLEDLLEHVQILERNSSRRPER